MKTYAYGFPRLGKDRRYKKHIENFWNNKITESRLVSLLYDIERERLTTYRETIDTYPVAEITPYDHVLDTACMFGIYKCNNLHEYYQYTRGRKALVMKKYFNTNYHYLVPKITTDKRFSLKWNKPLEFYSGYSQLKSKPVFCIGPFTLLKLSNLDRNFEKAFIEITDQYKKLFSLLKAKGVESIHLEEPAFTMDCTQKETKLIYKVYKDFLNTDLKVNLFTYYESVSFLKELFDLNFHAIGLDLIAGIDNVKLIKRYGFPNGKKLICGIVDGKNPMRSDIFNKAKQIDKIKHTAKIDYSNIVISNSCPLMHLPVTLENEDKMKASVKKNLSFAKEKLYELYLIKEVLSGKNTEAIRWSSHIKSAEITKRKKRFTTDTYNTKEFNLRQCLQRKKLNLPILPTTTIGSFPQDSILRNTRLDYKKKNIDKKTYDGFIKNKIKDLIQFQEKIGLDVLVHGEFERTDMVEFFAQKLDGFITTDKGWVISYGTRVYRPPIIYGTVKRKKPITVKEITYAQNLTNKPVKGIFTGPITILAWSYNLRRQPVYETAFEIANALHEEAQSLIKEGIPIIQIDEPAIREFAPIKNRKKSYYYSWAVKAFNMTARLPRGIQVHTHLCYSEFGEIINWVLKMNFDVITIESAREGVNIVDVFKNKKFARQIGPGVWDIHSKIPAGKPKIERLLRRIMKVFKIEQIWLNPDCGLKTRSWPEVKTSIKNIVDIANKHRSI